LYTPIPSSKRSKRKASANKAVLGTIEGRFRKSDRGVFVVAVWIIAGVLVEDDHSLVLLQPNLPVAGVSGKDDNVATVCDEDFDLVAHVFGPVLIMASANQTIVAGQEARVCVEVDACAVVNREALGFEPLDQRNFTRGDAAGPIERDLARAARLVKIRFAVEKIEALPASVVVSLFREECDAQKHRRQGSGGPGQYNKPENRTIDRVSRLGVKERIESSRPIYRNLKA
jgi:hypothetical protein